MLNYAKKNQPYEWPAWVTPNRCVVSRVRALTVLRDVISLLLFILRDWLADRRGRLLVHHPTQRQRSATQRIYTAKTDHVVNKSAIYATGASRLWPPADPRLWIHPLQSRGGRPLWESPRRLAAVYRVYILLQLSTTRSQARVRIPCCTFTTLLRHRCRAKTCTRSQEEESTPPYASAPPGHRYQRGTRHGVQ